LQARDSVSLADRPVLDGAEQGKQLIELDLSDLYVMQDVLRESAQLLRRLHEPLQDRIRVHLEHPRRAPDPQAFGQAADDPHDEARRGPLAVQDGADGLETAATTRDAEHSAPGT